MFAALHLPSLPVMASLRLHASLRSKPCAVLAAESEDEKVRGRLALLAVNDAARDAGIVVGWPLSRARVRCPDLLVLPRDRGEEQKMMEELLELAETLTPDLEVTSCDVVLLDLSRAPISRIQCLGELKIPGAEVIHVKAETPDLAHLGVLHPDLDGAMISPVGLRKLPLDLLRKMTAHETFMPLLELWGLGTLGEFTALPRQDLTERLGSRAGHWHDVLHGRICRLLRLHRVPESLEFSYDFEEPQASLEPVVFLLKRLLHGLSARVGSRHLAVERLHLVLRLESGDRVVRPIGLPEPLVEAGDMLRPLQTLLESLSLRAPVVGVDLDADTALPTSSQREWFARQLPHPGRWGETLARLEGLVGEGKMGIPVPSASHRPDAFRLLPAPLSHGRGGEEDDERRPASPLPMRRYRPSKFVSVAYDQEGDAPRPLALLTGPYPGQIVNRHGPFPMSGHWWDATASWHRLEWDIELANHQLMRLAYIPPDRWQLEGVYV
jgi:protein ImuB